MLGVTGDAIEGSCLCHGVRFRLTEPPKAAGYCHCTRCQGRTGSGASAQAEVDGRTFELLEGGGLAKMWRHPDDGLPRHPGSPPRG